MTENNMSMLEKLQLLSDDKKKQFMGSLTDVQVVNLVHDIEFIGRPKQIVPQGDWDTLLVLAGRGFGKRLNITTPIPTPTGWTTMGDIRGGDIIFNEQGQTTKVIKAHNIFQNTNAYRVKFSDNSYIDADAEHLWSVKTHNIRKNNIRQDCKTKPHHRPNVVKTTTELIPLLRHGNRGDLNLSVDITKPLELPHIDLPIDPYLLGYWLGDGTSCRAEITVSHDDASELLKYIDNLGFGIRKTNKKPDSNCATYKIYNDEPLLRNKNGSPKRNPKSTVGILDTLGVLNNKHIPSHYLRASYDQRLALLQGLMDSDGTASKLSNACAFDNTTKALSDGVYELIMTLGMKATRRDKYVTLYGKPCGIDYQVNFTPNKQVFQLKRKAIRLDFTKSQQNRHTHRMITDIVPIDSVPMRCITVDSPSHLYLCGKSFIPTHNTFMGAHAVNSWARDNPKCRIALVGETTKDVREVIVKGESGILNQSHPSFKPTYNMANGILTYPNGSTCQTFSAEEPDQLRGPNFHFALLDELAKYRYQEDVWDMLQFCLRLGTHPQVIVTTTPRPTKLIKKIANDPTTQMITGSTFENTTLPDKFIEKMKNKYEGTRLGEQELFAKILDDNPNALFNSKDIDEPRIRHDSNDHTKAAVYYRKIIDSMDRIVVAIDPAVTAEITSDETGIVICGRKGDQGYVIGDASLIETPQGWAASAIYQYKEYGADMIVAEINQGGDMVESILRNVDKFIPYKSVRATRGKKLRAEPVAALYEQHRIHHLGYFPELEQQMIDYDPTLGNNQDSPDRMDALAYAFTELFGIELAEPNIVFI